MGTWCKPALKIVAGVLALSLAGCGGGGGDAPTLVVKGSASAVATVSASWWQRLLALAGLGAVHADVTTAGSPTVLKMRFHALRLSANADCSAPYLTVQVFDPPREFDLVAAPTLFEGSPPPGTYRCIVFEADDHLAVVPDAVAQAAFPGRCRAGVEHVTDLYRSGDPPFRDLAGATIAARGSRGAPVVDRVHFFATTDPAAAQARSGGPAATQTLPLTSALVVPGRTTLYVDATDGLLGDTEDGVDYCVVEAGRMGFR